MLIQSSKMACLVRFFALNSGLSSNDGHGWCFLSISMRYWGALLHGDLRRDLIRADGMYVGTIMHKLTDDSSPEEQSLLQRPLCQSMQPPAIEREQVNNHE